MHVVSALAAFGSVVIVAGLMTERNLAGLLIVMTTAYMTFLPAAAQSPQDRYRVPVDGLLFMLAAFGASQFYGRFLSAHKRRHPGARAANWKTPA